MQIERHEIRVFSAVVEEGTFSRAAERLNVSQSAVSQTIANLEHKLDAVLIERRGKSMRGASPSRSPAEGSPNLTEAGKRLFGFTRTVIQEERSALEDLTRIRSGALSTLSLAMNSLFKRFLGKPLLLEFCQRNPLTRLKLDVAPGREIVYGVDEGRWELGLGPFQTQMPGHFRLLPLTAEERLLAVHESHPRFHAFRSDPSGELARTTLLTSYLDEAAKRPGRDRIRNRVASVWEISDLELRLSLAEAGQGVLYLSDRLHQALTGFHLIEGLEISRLPRQVGLYHNKHKALSEGAKRFIAICQEQFNGA